VGFFSPPRRPQKSAPPSAPKVPPQKICQKIPQKYFMNNIKYFFLKKKACA
jgi:hypothetical protein